jgi:hypothetical protein
MRAGQFGHKQRTKIEPAFQPLAKFALPGVIGAPELCGQAEITEDRNAFLALGREASIRKPHKEVQCRWGGRQSLSRFEIRGYRVRGHLAKELVAEHDYVFKAAGQ